jgi:membrane protease YdiL (CAAX protease family)
MTTITAFIKRHPLPVYYGVTFAISWGAIFLVVGAGGFLSITGASPSFAVAGPASLLGPSLAGVLLISLVDGREGWCDLLSRLRRWRVGVRWYAVALLSAPLVTTMTLLALSFTSPAFVPVVTAEDKASLLLSAIAAGLIVSFFEELGWTGFATPKWRRRHGVLATGLIMGLLWGAWHFPLFAGNAASSGGIPPALMMAALLFSWLVPYRVLIVLVYDRTQSLLVTMLMHMPIVVGAIVLNAEAVSAEERFTSLIFTGSAYCVVVGGVALANRWHLTRKRPPRAAPDGLTV